MIIAPYAVGAASPSEIISASAPFGGAVFVIDDSHPAAIATRLLLDAVGGRVTTTGEGKAGVERLLVGAPPDGIVTFADTTIEATLDLAEAFELTYHSRATALCLLDKLIQRRRLNEAGVGHVPIAEVLVGAGSPTPDAGLFPAVVKPRRGSGSEQTVIVPNVCAFAEMTAPLDPERAYIAEGYIADGVPVQDWLANYLSVESVVRGSQIVHLGVTGRLPLAEPARETGALFPIELPSGQFDELTAFAERAIHALGISLGIVHTEIKLAPNGPQIIEVNGRLGGRLNRLMSMVGMTEPVATAVAVAAGKPLPERRSPSGVALSFWLQPPVRATTVLAVPPVRELTVLPGVKRAKLIRPPGTDVDWRLGTGGLVLELWFYGIDHNELRRSYLRAREILDAAVAFAQDLTAERVDDGQRD